MNTRDDTFYMHQALVQARKAAAADEVPVGAIIIDPRGEIIARAYNQVEHRQTQVAHAELRALAQAGKKRGWRLDDCWLYVTLEPCAMCMHAIKLSRISGVVFATSSPIFGYQLDNHATFPVYQWPMMVKSGVCAHESAQLLKDFFKHKRRAPSGSQK